MYSTQLCLSAAILIAAAELVIWNGFSPETFQSTFDPVQRDDVSIEPQEIDFGNLALVERQTQSVRITNNKRRAIQLRQPRATCGCVRFALDEPLSIPPGETAAIEFDLVAPGVPGPISKDLLLQFSTADGPFRIPVRANAIASSWADPPHHRLTLGQVNSGLIHLPTSKQVADVIVSHPEHVHVTLGRATATTQAYRVEVTGHEAGEGYIAWMSEEEECLATVNVHWDLPMVLVCQPKRVILDPVASERTSTCEVTVLNDPEQVAELKMETMVPWARVVSKEKRSARTMKIKIELDRTKSPHRFRGDVLRIYDAQSEHATTFRVHI